MTRLNDDAVAAEDAASGEPRTREEWDQLAASLDAAYRAPTLAHLPDFSTMFAAERTDVGSFEFKTTHTKPVGNERQRALYQAVCDAANIDASLNAIRVHAPVVYAAMTDALKSENTAKRYPSYRHRCDACLDARDRLEAFESAPLLFVHLLTCPHFAAIYAEQP